MVTFGRILWCLFACGVVLALQSAVLAADPPVGSRATSQGKPAENDDGAAGPGSQRSASRPQGAPASTTKKKFVELTFREREEIARKQLAINAKVLIPPGGICVGDEVQIKVALKNISGEKLSVFRPENRIVGSIERGDQLPDIGVFHLRRPFGPPYPLKERADDFLLLEPGETTKEVLIRVVPIAPGRYTASVRYDNNDRETTYLPTGSTRPGKRWRRIDPVNPFRGLVWAHPEFEVSDTVTPDRKARYEKAKQLVSSPEADATERDKAIEELVSEGHVVAARVIVGIWRDSKDKKVKDKVFAAWMKLLERGVAYDSLPMQLGFLRILLRPTKCGPRFSTPFPGRRLGTSTESRIGL